jgi:hypothetical protein
MFKFFITTFILCGYAFSDTIITDPILKPPQFTGTPTTCPLSYGCLGYSQDLRKMIWHDGTTWQPMGTGYLDEWAAGKSYKIGEIKNSGSDKNWLFKIVQDHTSANVPADMKAGKILAISPPIITTGVQDGGVVSLIGTTAFVSTGTGYIAKYGESPSAFPIITIVEWVAQSKVLTPPTGIHTLYIDSNGLLVSVVGFGASTFGAQDDTISVGIVDLSLNKAYNRGTFPTNPVGQLRGLAFFFGGMTKGLSYTGSATRTLARTAYEVYSWGTNTASDRPYNPNTTNHSAVGTVNFYEYNKFGLISATIKTQLQTVYEDSGGSLIALGGARWGFARIYTTLHDEDYVMYGQAHYPDEKTAKDAAISSAFIKPADLALTKFSAWVVFKGNDTDFTDNPVITCEPFGCDKIGTVGGGAGGGTGDVLGPASSLVDSIALFSDTSGKAIKSTPYTVPTTVCSNNQILKSNGTNYICATDVDTDTNSGGNVVGPASAADNAIVRYDLTTGKIIQNSGAILDDLNNLYTPGQIWSKNYNDTDTTIDFNNGNNQYVTGNCGTYTLQNMNDGGIYTLAVQGATASNCSFTTSYTNHYPPGYVVPTTLTTANKHTLFTFIRMGSHLYIYWVPGL